MQPLRLIRTMIILRDIHVQVHPVNAFYLQRHMLPQNLGYAPW